MCTDTSLSAIEIIRLYGLRFKIEHGFKQATRQIGSFAYHFWMKDMIPLRTETVTSIFIASRLTTGGISNAKSTLIMSSYRLALSLHPMPDRHIQHQAKVFFHGSPAGFG
jgi:hypothetical protein